jgi:FixJ family two-component response regulator
LYQTVGDNILEATPTVFIVDDDENIRQILAMMCKSAGLEAITFSSALRFLVEYDKTQAGCLILDIKMSDMDGLELQKKLITQNIHIPIIFISGLSNVSMAVRAMKEGAFDFFEKPFDNDLLINRIHQAVSLDVQKREEQAHTELMRKCFSQLTEREKQVMDLIVSGMVTKQIAHKLAISTKTVDFHRTHIMEKLGIGSIAELVHKVLAFMAKNNLEKI